LEQANSLESDARITLRTSKRTCGEISMNEPKIKKSDTIVMLAQGAKK
jgi:hypothetical protein